METTAGRRPPLRRPVQGRWVAGVCTGLAAHLCTPVWIVRGLVAGLVAAGGAGAVGYLLLWALVPSAGEAPAGPSSRAPARRGVRWVTTGETGWQLVWGVGLLVLGAALLAERAGLPLDPATVVPAAVVVAGAAVVWGQLDAAERGRWLASAGGGTQAGLARLVAGLALSAIGILLLATQGAGAAALRPALVAAVAVLAGVGLLLAPWGLRLWRDLETERAARVRESERAEVAAHLHDSVLQTLSLIQRRSGDPTEVVRLARGQERELREWLYGAPPAAPESTLAMRLRRELAEVEDRHGVPVDLVVVGDTPLDARSEALALALREATLNAVRHGAPPVQVYVEAAAGAVEAFVRDHGEGFDLDAVPTDRLGVRESVLGRMARAGGSATLRRAPGGGTEVALRLAAPTDTPTRTGEAT